MLKRRVLLFICVMFLLFGSVGCSDQKVTIDPDANMIGETTKVTDDTEFGVIVVIENAGSDYALPDKGFVFNVVKFQFVNNSENAIELKESDFVVVVDDKELTPITGDVNFVVDKMPETVTVMPGTTLITKLVWTVPSKAGLKVLSFNPSFAPDETIKFNLNEEG